MTTLRENEILFPVGRMVAGSLYQAQMNDAEGKPRLFKSGPKVGQPNPQFFFAVAIPKQPGHTHWSQTEWGAKIWRIGHAAFPNVASNPAFAWKITDGDSAIPNKRGTAPNTREGYPGHWVVSFSSGFAPKLYNAMTNPVSALPEPEAIKPGYFIEVLGTCAGNDSPNQPGVFVNHSMVALRGYGQEIYFGPDPSQVGFGQSQVPAGASSVPTSSTVLPAAVPAAAPAPVPAAPTAAAPAPVPAAPTAVQPHPGILTPAAPAAPAVPVAPAAPVKTMTAKAAGATYEQFRANNWTDEMLVAQGYMTIS